MFSLKLDFFCPPKVTSVTIDQYGQNDQKQRQIEKQQTIKTIKSLYNTFY